VMFNGKGLFVGQICHIEAAAPPGGERFNPNQTNEERRHPSNLMLMCYEHHVETNDVARFPTPILKGIKEDHEKLYSDVIEKMLLTVTDYTKVNKPTLPRNLARFNAVLNYTNTTVESAESLAEMHTMIARLGKVPTPSRQLFEVLVNRSHGASFGPGFEASVPDIQQATNLSTNEFLECLSILKRHGLTQEGGVDDFNTALISIRSLPSGWNLWQDFKIFAEKNESDLAQLIVDLDFSVLDSKE